MYYPPYTVQGDRQQCVGLQAQYLYMSNINMNMSCFLGPAGTHGFSTGEEFMMDTCQKLNSF